MSKVYSKPIMKKSLIPADGQTTSSQNEKDHISFIRYNNDVGSMNARIELHGITPKQYQLSN
ncbi:hypothetical protein SAMN05443550_10182 [Pedobacter hartonius]|uniref:Uncharacterized protein n=1 Tax=Pedobacter hartonius TaxID=425514 RepID=A0A1H3W5M1_9SPHI|nr:hypothetical protein SAMN05443550_10182 [Pedobacter hartonius]